MEQSRYLVCLKVAIISVYLRNWAKATERIHSRTDSLANGVLVLCSGGYDERVSRIHCEKPFAAFAEIRCAIP